jgi:hypothetical protein
MRPNNQDADLGASSMQVSESVRRFTRLEYSLHQLLLGGGLGSVLPGSTAWDLAQTLARSSQGALLDLHAAFPKSPIAKSGSVQTFIKVTYPCLGDVLVPSPLSESVV